jgi:transcriptional regulator with XRE-family HTH domain
MCDALLALGLPLNRSTLLQYERGTVTSPDPAVLWGLSRLYHVTVDDLVLDLVRDRTHRPVPARIADGVPLTDAQRRAAEYIAQVDSQTAEQFLRFLAYLANPSKPQTPPPPKLVSAPSKARSQKG